MGELSLGSANEIIERQLHKQIEGLEELLDADILAFVGEIVGGVDRLFRDALEHNQDKQRKLFVILETNGGYIEVVDRIVWTLRHHYSVIDFIIPSHACSAGTVLVMSGDAIWMDYYSILGPIDPQVEKSGGLVPALGYVEEYETLIEKSRQGTLTTAETTFLVQRFDPAELSRFKHARDLSISLLEEWLVRYKFKNWKVTETRKKPVTLADKKKRANQIGQKLTETRTWHSHGRGISMSVLRKDIGLQINDFGENSELNTALKLHEQLLTDYMFKRRHKFAVVVRGRYFGV